MATQDVGSGFVAKSPADQSSEKSARGSASVRVVRVFPIRINEELPLSQSSTRRQPRNSQVNEQSSIPPVQPGAARITNDEVKIPTPSTVPSTGQATPLVTASHVVQESTEAGSRFITTRFNHLTFDGHSAEPHEGQEMYRCEDEPIHVPGAIQRFGALLAVRESEAGKFPVRIASENTEEVIGYTPDKLFDLDCLTDVFSADQIDDFTTRVRSIKEDDSEVRQDVFALRIRSPRPGIHTDLFCALHLNRETDLIVCEFELENAVFNPVSKPLSNRSSLKPISIIDDQVAKGHTPHPSPSSRTPLHSVGISRKMSRPLGPMEMFSILTEVQTRLSKSQSLPALLDTIVSLVYELTGFHRISKEL
jgi:hypothetical protein